MEGEIKKKASQLLDRTRVMTLAVSKEGIPWSSPVYFVFHDKQFYFFSNENSRHIQYTLDKKQVSVSVFHDSDRIDEIFGFQMTGTLTPVKSPGKQFTIIKQYVEKFDFLKTELDYGSLENKDVFLEKFKSRLYCFLPDKIFLSDNSRTSDKRVRVSLKSLDGVGERSG